MIACRGLRLPAELNREPAAQKISEALPVQGLAKRWGEEIYFEVPVDSGLDAKPKAYSAVNIIGKLLKLPREALKAVKPGTTITIEQA